MSARILSYGRALNESIRSEMQRDPSVFIMGEDIAGAAGKAAQGFKDAWGGPFTLTRGLLTEFGSDRVRDTPISESAFLGAAVGAAVTGMRPIVDLMFVDFIGVCYDAMLNNASKMRYMFGGQAKVPMVLMTQTGAGTRSGAQHSSSLYPVFVHLPGLKCVAPSDGYSVKGLMAAAIRDDDPVVLFNHRLLMPLKGEVPEESYILPIGKARIVRPGKDVTLVGIAAMVRVCQQAAEALAKEGIEAEVIDLLSLSPLDDEAILKSVEKTSRLVIVDEDNPRCGMASDIAAIVSEKGFDLLDAPIKRVTAPHAPVPYSLPLEQAYIPDAPKVIAAVKSIMG